MPIWPNLAGAVLGNGNVCTGSFIADCVLIFIFYFGDVLALFLTRLPLGDSY